MAEKEYSPEVLTLRDRVKLGNYKLFKAWQQLCEIAHNSEYWSAQMERWHQAQSKLSGLCSELKYKGYEDCLYIEKGKKTKGCLEEPDCYVCPSIINYWERELMGLPGPKAKQTISGEDQMEFLKTLGGEK